MSDPKNRLVSGLFLYIYLCVAPIQHKEIQYIHVRNLTLSYNIHDYLHIVLKATHKQKSNLHIILEPQYLLDAYTLYYAVKFINTV